MSGGSKIRNAVLCGLAAVALAGGACTHDGSPAPVKPATYAPGVAGGVIVDGPAIPDSAVTDAPGGITDGHTAADVPATSAAAPQPTLPPDPGMQPTADESYTPAD